MKKMLELIQSEINQIKKKDLLQECLDILNDEKQIVMYDFSEILSILKEQDLAINSNDLDEIKQVIQIRNMINRDVPFSSSQLSTLNLLKKNLQIALENLKKVYFDVTVHDLEILKDLFSGKIQKDYDYEKNVQLLLIHNLDSITEDDAFIMNNEELSIQENIKTNNNKVEWNEVVNLFKDFLYNDNQDFNDFVLFLNHYKDEILDTIHLDNSRNILQFFKEKDCLSKFEKSALIKICVFANREYVEKIYQEHGESGFYYTDMAATLWICSSPLRKKIVSERKDANSISDGQQNTSLYSQCHFITDEEFWKNISFLKENINIFSNKYRENINQLVNFLNQDKLDESYYRENSTFRALLASLMKDSSLIKKNVSLFKIFNINNIPISSLWIGDVEDKIHLAIELGLLHPPIDRNLDEEIYSYDTFRQRKPFDENMRDYFSRYVTNISTFDIYEYAFYKYALNILGYSTFYNYFLSERRAGERNQKVLDEAINAVPKTLDSKEDFILEHFVMNRDYIDDYEEYDRAISEYDEIDNKYYNEDILKDELIQKMENKFRVMDLSNNEKKKNEFVYQINNTYISRYKVLRNAAILKKKYGTLNENLLMSAIVRNSFLSKEEFSNIQNEVKQIIQPNKSFNL